MILQANGSPPKKVNVAIFITDKIDFKPKMVTRDKDEYFLMTKVVIHQEDITVINIYIFT